MSLPLWKHGAPRLPSPVPESDEPHLHHQHFPPPPTTTILGAPAIPKPAGANVSSWRVGGGTPEVGVYVRYFAQGVVVVCPGDVSATAKTWLAGGPYEDRLSGEKGITEIKMAANSGRILLKQQEDH